MNRPTRGQRRGYLVLCTVLAVALLVMILLPVRHTPPTPVDNAAIKELIEQYGDSMSIHRTENKQWSKHERQRNAMRPLNKPEKTNRNHKRHYEPAEQIDLNNADTSDLCKLYGIGPVFASRIVKYRTRLGGYVRKEQLLEVYGMDSDRYANIADHVVADQAAVKKIDVNTATAAQLRDHPYLDYYQARAIVDYRRGGNRYATAQDLLKVSLLDEQTVAKLDGYITYGN